MSRFLESMDKRSNYHQEYKKTIECKERRRARVQENFKLYDKKKETDQGYNRYGALADVVPALYIPPATLAAPFEDHNYSTNQVTVTLPFSATAKR